MRRKHSTGNDTPHLESITPRTRDYSTWNESELRREIARRRLAHGVGFSGVFSDDDVRKARLVEILTSNDVLSSSLKQIAARYIGHPETLDKKHTEHESHKKETPE